MSADKMFTAQEIDAIFTSTLQLLFFASLYCLLRLMKTWFSLEKLGVGVEWNLLTHPNSFLLNSKQG